jgi:hypothetical protein
MYILTIVNMFKFKLASWLLGNDHKIVKSTDKVVTKTQAELITDIMDNFNFKKVQSVMKFLNWRWSSAEDGVPTVMEIRKEARKLLVEVCKLCLEQQNINSDTRVVVGTGGLRATAFRSECSAYIAYLELDFVVASCDTEVED